MVCEIDQSGKVEDTRKLTFFEKFGKIPPAISFQRIGKKSQAHIAALLVFQGKKKPDLVATAKDLFVLFYGKNKK